VELVPLVIAAVAFVVAKSAGPVANLITEWRLQNFCRDVYDDAVTRDKNFDPVEMIMAARGERSSPSAEAPKLTALPGDSSNEAPKKKTG
jgi:hypothetical protein